MLSLEEQRDSLQRKLKVHNLVYEEIRLEEISLIYDLYFYGLVGIPQTGLQCIYFGSYYLKVNRDLTQAEFYYRQAIELGNTLGWAQLGNLYVYYYKNVEVGLEFWRTGSCWIQMGHYYQITGKYDLMLPFYQASLEQGNADAAFNLGYYYQHTTKEFDLAMYYYQIAARQGYSQALNAVGYLCCHHLKDTRRMKIYYQQAIRRGELSSIINLASYYQRKNKLKRCRYYAKLAVSHGDTSSITYLKDHYLTKAVQKKYLLFGLRHHVPDLITRHYQKKYVHYLLRASGSLDEFLAKQKHAYVETLLRKFRRQNTWFRWYCVADVVNLIGLFL